MRNLFLLITFIAILTSATDVYAQVPTDTFRLSRQLLNVKDGLSQGLISSIIQDKDGFMWFGTKEGLNKYDGYKFTIYKHEAGNPFSLPDNYVHGIAEDDNGNFWVQTLTKGLFLFDRKNEKFYPIKLPMMLGTTTALLLKLEHKNGRLIVYSPTATIYDISKLSEVNFSNPDVSKVSICWDEIGFLRNKKKSQKLNKLPSIHLIENTLWVAYNDTLTKYSINAIGKFEIECNYPLNMLSVKADSIFSISKLNDEQEYLIVGDNELVIYDFKNKRQLQKKNLNGVAMRKSTLKDVYGNYFITSDIQVWDYYHVEKNELKVLAGDWGSAGCLDDHGIIWLGTPGNGIIKHDYRQQLFHHTNPGIPGHKNKNHRGEAAFNNKYVPSFYNLYSNSITPIFKKYNWNKSDGINEFIADRNGIYWIMFVKFEKSYEESRFLMRYNEATGETRIAELKDYAVRNQVKLILDAEDNLWINLMDEKGMPQLIKWNENRFAKDTTFTIPALPHKIFGYFISAYLLDENKVFWFATTQGLYAFNPSAADTSKIWKRYGNIPNDPSSLSFDYLLTIVADPYQPEKYLWLGSDGGGLSRFDKSTGKFTNYTEKDGLPNNVIYSLLCDSSKNIWMSTNRGLCCMYAHKFKSGVVADKTWFRNFTSEDGLPGDEFNRQEYFKLPNGDLCFFGPAGGVYFTPGEVLEEGKPPRVAFTGLSVFNQPVNLKLTATYCHSPLPMQSRLCCHQIKICLPYLLLCWNIVPIQVSNINTI